MSLSNNDTIINENDHSEATNKITADLEKDLASAFLNEHENLDNSLDSEGDCLELIIQSSETTPVARRGREIIKQVSRRVKFLYFEGLITSLPLLATDIVLED